MGYLKYVREAWKRPSVTIKALMRERLIAWRREPVTVRLERPTRIDRARSLGYKAKQGFIVVRQRVDRGGRMRAKFSGGRRTKHNRRFMILDKNYQQVAEERVSRKYTNCEVLNSYPVAKDGLYAWYEVILVDWAHPSISADERVGWIGDQRGRAERGLTSAGKKARGLRNKGQGSEKARPSRAAVFRRKVKRQHLKGNTKF